MNDYIEVNNIKLPNVVPYSEEVIFTSLPTSVFVNYIDILFNRFHKNVCYVDIPNLSEYFVEIDVTDLSYKISDRFKNTLTACYVVQKDLFVIPIHLRFPVAFENNENSDVSTSGHSNTVIIDNISRTIEFFEPHGVKYNGGLHFDTEKLIKAVIADILPKESETFQFHNVYRSCPNLGVQRGDSFCLAWSLLFIELRLINQHYSAEYMVNALSSLDNNFLLFYLKKYIAYVVYQLRNTLALKKTFESYPRNKIQNISLNDIIPQNIIKQRILLLLEEYNKIADDENDILIKQLIPEIYEHNSDKRKVIFNELISYRNFEGFHELFFEYFDNICKKKSKNIMESKKRKI